MCYLDDDTLIVVTIPSIRSKSSLERSHQPIGTQNERPKSSYGSPKNIISENTLEPFQSASKPKRSQEEVLHSQPGFRHGLILRLV